MAILLTVSACEETSTSSTCDPTDAGQDAGMQMDSSTDAGATCPPTAPTRTYSLTDLDFAEPSNGLDVDGVGSEGGCGDDGYWQSDNAFAETLPLAQAYLFDLDDGLDDAVDSGAIAWTVEITPGDGCARVAFASSGIPVAENVVIVNDEGRFRLDLGTLLLDIPWSSETLQVEIHDAAWVGYMPSDTLLQSLFGGRLQGEQTKAEISRFASELGFSQSQINDLLPYFEAYSDLTPIPLNDGGASDGGASDGGASLCSDMSIAIEARP